MFTTDEEVLTKTEFPKESDFRECDWHILAGFWHPIAFSHEIESRPVAAKLLDVNLVIFRTSTGLTVARDTCPHRSTALSKGHVIDDHLVCPMHGAQFDEMGQCRKLPSLEDQSRPISPMMNLKAYCSEERYGIVWTCLKPEPIWPLPVWPGIKETSLRKVFVPVETWQCSAIRHTENFNDQAHFPFVHLGSFGSDDDLSTHDYAVEETEFGLRFDYHYVEGGNRFPDGIDKENREVVYSYELTFPFSTLIYVDVQESAFVHYFADAVCPVSVNETKMFQTLTDTTGNPNPDYWIHDSLQILSEDRPLVESQPAHIALGKSDETHHIPADRWSIVYRRVLRERFGLGKV